MQDMHGFSNFSSFCTLAHWKQEVTMATSDSNKSCQAMKHNADTCMYKNNLEKFHLNILQRFSYQGKFAVLGGLHAPTPPHVRYC